MQIPKYNHDKRYWDKFKYFYNDIDGPFCLLETGDVVIISDNYRMAGKFPSLNVEIVEARKLTRREPKPDPRFEFFKYPCRGHTYVSYDCLARSEDTHYLIDHDTKRIHAVSQEITSIRGNAVPCYVANDRITRHIVGYVRPNTETTEQQIVTCPIRLKVEVKPDREIRTHLKNMMASAKAWFAMSDMRRMNHTKQTWTDYYSYTDAKQNKQTLVPDTWSYNDLYEGGKPIVFTDLSLKLRLSMAVRKPDKFYHTQLVEHLEYDGPALTDNE